MKVAELRQEEIEKSERVVAELNELAETTEAKIMEVEAARSAEEVGLVFVHACVLCIFPGIGPPSHACQHLVMGLLEHSLSARKAK